MSISKLATALGFAFASVGAGAATVTFDELQTLDTTFYESIVSGGFVFTNTVTANLGVWGDADASLFKADLFGASVFVDAASVTTMANSGGLAFDLASIDFADVFNEGASGTLEFTFAYAAGGTATQMVTLDSVIGLETITFNQAGLSSVSWESVSSTPVFTSNQFDNVNVTAIPEPGTYALMLGGLGALGLYARRRAPG